MAAYFILFVLSMISFEAVSSHDVLPLYVPGVPTQISLINGSDFTCEDKEFGPSCANCYTVKFCTGEKDPAVNVTCAETDPKKIYCSGGQCTDKKNSSDSTCTSSGGLGFKCTFDGYAPDPDDCRVYYYCLNKVATPYECPANYTYDHTRKTCKQQKSSTDCALMKCTSGRPFVEYAPDKSIYGVCNADKKVTVFQCDENEWFSVETASCKLSCRQEGPFADPKDCHGFYTCYKIDGKWDLTHEKCPSGAKFDKEKLHCVQGSC